MWSGGSTHTVEHTGPGAGLAVLVYGFDDSRTSYGYVAGSAYRLIRPGTAYIFRHVLELIIFTKEVVNVMS